nr:Crp/Fnr family transcriptional regulator [uncultured Mediterraneibacter sp.]
MDYLALSRTPLFSGTAPEEIESMLQCLRAEVRAYKKEERILSMGDTVSEIGIVLSGSVRIENNDIWGNRSLLDRAGAGQIFAETYACVPGEKLMVDVVAAEDTRILLLNVGRLITTCPNTCAYHEKLIRNLLTVSAQKNLHLSRRIFHNSPKSIRGKLLSYLSDQAVRCGKKEFDIPFNRQELADYLGVDRSAMSNELGKMQKEGLLLVRRSHFRLL